MQNDSTTESQTGFRAACTTSLKAGDVFAARARDAQRLIAAGQAEPVNAKGETVEEKPSDRRERSKNAARKRK